MKFSKMFLILVAKSLLISASLSYFNFNYVSAMELKKEDELKQILKKAIIDLLSENHKTLIECTEELKLKYANAAVLTIRICVLKTQIIGISKSLFNIYHEYKYSTNYQHTIKQLRDYIKENENYKNYYLKYSYQMENRNYMRQIFDDIYSDSEYLINEFDKIFESIRNSINILHEYNADTLQILQVFDIPGLNLFSSKFYLFPFI